MKNILKTLGCVLFLFGQPQFLSAQSPGGFSPHDPHGPPVLVEDKPFLTNSPAWKKKVDAYYDGLPMYEIIKLLREQFPEVNFVHAGEVENVTPKLLLLKSVTLDDILTALTITTKGELKAERMNEKMVAFYYQPLEERDQRKVSRAFSLAGYLSGRSKEDAAKALKDLEQALRTSSEMVLRANPGQKNETPSLSMHEATKMLIAVGTLEQLEMIAQFIEQLGHDELARLTEKNAAWDERSTKTTPSTNKPASPK